MKKITITYHKQKDQDHCGPAAISMAVEAVGIAIDQSKITDVILKQENTSTLKNSYFHDMCGYLKDSGLNPLYVGGLSDDLTWKLIKTYTKKNIPLVVLQRYSRTIPRSHFRVIIGHQFVENKKQHRIYYHDPRDGPNQFMMKDEFFDLWKPEIGSHQRRSNEFLIIQKKPFTIPDEKCNFCQSDTVVNRLIDLPNNPPNFSYVNSTTKIIATCIHFQCPNCQANYIIAK